MKLVTRTGDYSIYKKRNQRYAVRDRNRQWVRGEDKVAILVAHNLVSMKPQLKAPDLPESPPGEGQAATEAGSAGVADEGGAEGGAEGGDEAGEATS